MRRTDSQPNWKNHTSLLSHGVDWGLISLRFEHFELLQPVCPQCLHTQQQAHRLAISTSVIENEHGLIEGLLACTNTNCQLEYPVIDGIPIIVPEILNYIRDNLYHITARTDLSGVIESVLGDCAGPRSHYDVSRQHLSSYAWDHYGDVSYRADRTPAFEAGTTSSILSCLHAEIELLEHEPRGPMIDLGCSVGRVSFELAEKFAQPVLGVDVNFSMLSLAQSILRGDDCSYPLRHGGVVYEPLSPNGNFSNKNQVDFWACDAQALPFAGDQFGFACGMNVLDSVGSPLSLLNSIGRCLQSSGEAVLTCPYDWSPTVTSMEHWIGGHSQRGPTHGSPEIFLRTLLTPGAHPQSIEGLSLTGEIEGYPWTVRVHSRSQNIYSTHVVGIKKTTNDQEVSS